MKHYKLTLTAYVAKSAEQNRSCAVSSGWFRWRTATVLPRPLVLGNDALTVTVFPVTLSSLSLTMNSDAVLLLETVNFAAEKHRNQRRKDIEQTPYINHSIGTNVPTFLWRLQVHRANQLTETEARIKQKYVRNRVEFWNNNKKNIFTTYKIGLLSDAFYFMCVLVRSSQNSEPWRWSDGHWGFAGKPQVLLYSPELIQGFWADTVLVPQAALLHDTIEDTDTSPAELQATFGPVVARIVQEVTDDRSLPKQERKRHQVEHAPHCSPQAKLVKLADKLYNLRDLNRCTPVGQKPLSSYLVLISFHCLHILYRWQLSVCLQVGRPNGFRNIFCGLVRLWKAWGEHTRFWRRGWTSCSNKEESSPDCRTTLDAQIHILFVNSTNRYRFFFISTRVFLYIHIFVSVRIYR